jgi:hypothetical protein
MMADDKATGHHRRGIRHLQSRCLELVDLLIKSKTNPGEEEGAFLPAPSSKRRASTVQNVKIRI